MPPCESSSAPVLGGVASIPHERTGRGGDRQLGSTVTAAANISSAFTTRSQPRMTIHVRRISSAPPPPHVTSARRGRRHSELSHFRRIDARLTGPSIWVQAQLMIELSEQQIIDEIAQRLTAIHPAVPPQDVSRLVHEEHARFEGRPVRDFVPLFRRAKRQGGAGENGRRRCDGAALGPTVLVETLETAWPRRPAFG
jgi:hypothetical protein